jgi:hypothetical protein
MNLYGIEKRNTIENAYLMFSYLDDTLDYCSTHGLMYVTCADVPGYMNEGCSTVHAYNGKYGKGVVRTRPCFYKGRRSTNYMTIFAYSVHQARKIFDMTTTGKYIAYVESINRK